METKLCRMQMEKVRQSCGFTNGIDIGSEGTTGGLCLAWRNDTHITLQNFSRLHIDVVVKGNEINVKWHFTGCYRTRMLKIEKTHGLF